MQYIQKHLYRMSELCYLPMSIKHFYLIKYLVSHSLFILYVHKNGVPSSHRYIISNCSKVHKYIHLHDILSKDLQMPLLLKILTSFTPCRTDISTRVCWRCPSVGIVHRYTISVIFLSCTPHRSGISFTIFNH